MELYITYKYRMYDNKQLRHIDDALTISTDIWNHCIALLRYCYKRHHKMISITKMKSHIAKLRRNRSKYAAWKQLNSQAIQDIIERIYKSYDAFFSWLKDKSSGKKSIPHFKKPSRYTSFTLKQTGYKYHNGNRITIMGRDYKFVCHRPLQGEIKTITIKRTHSAKYFICFTVIEDRDIITTRTGNTVGIDFGLKHFLTLSNGETIDSPQWYKQLLPELRFKHRNLSRCMKNSNHRKRKIHELDLLYEKIDNKRIDFFFKLANQLVAAYDVIYIEDLNIKAMQQLWGRKISDLAFSEFITVLKHIAVLHGKAVVEIDRWYPSSKTCHTCGNINEVLTLKDRVWTCPHCGQTHDRDVNAAINIRNEGQRIA